MKKLRSILDQHGIACNKWPDGRIEKLLSHINSGKTELWRKDGILYSRRQFAVVDVVYQIPTTTLCLRLVEDHTKNIRNKHIRHSRPHLGINVKISNSESPLLAAEKALMSKLGIENPVGLEKIGETSEPVLSDMSCPGLPGKHKMFIYRYRMPEKLYNSDGYQFRKNHSDIIVFFRWDPIKKDADEKRVAP